MDAFRKHCGASAEERGGKFGGSYYKVAENGCDEGSWCLMHGTTKNIAGTTRTKTSGIGGRGTAVGAAIGRERSRNHAETGGLAIAKCGSACMEPPKFPHSEEEAKRFKQIRPNEIDASALGQMDIAEITGAKLFLDSVCRQSVQGREALS
jgi:hypothetical protein